MQQNTTNREIYSNTRLFQEMRGKTYQNNNKKQPNITPKTIRNKKTKKKKKT